MEYITAPPSRDPPQLTAELQKRSRQLDNLENSLLTTSSELKKLKENHAETLKVGFLEASTATECASQWFFRGEAAPCSFRDGVLGPCLRPVQQGCPCLWPWTQHKTVAMAEHSVFPPPHLAPHPQP